MLTNNSLCSALLKIISTIIIHNLEIININELKNTNVWNIVKFQKSEEEMF